jgi:hypothetical protein
MTTINIPSNPELLIQLAESRAVGYPTSELVTSMLAIATASARTPPYDTYAFEDERINEATFQLLRSWSVFKPNLSDNPLEYFQIVAISASIQHICKERNESQLKEDYDVVEQIAREAE